MNLNQEGLSISTGSDFRCSTEGFCADIFKLCTSLCEEVYCLVAIDPCMSRNPLQESVSILLLLLDTRIWSGKPAGLLMLPGYPTKFKKSSISGPFCDSFVTKYNCVCLNSVYQWKSSHWLGELLVGPCNPYAGLWFILDPSVYCISLYLNLGKAQRFRSSVTIPIVFSISIYFKFTN